MELDGLKRYAASKQIALGTVEKDCVLSVVLSQLSKSQFANQLIFKGGTAIKKAYFPDARFSVDLDFNFFDISGDALVKEISELFSGKTILETVFEDIKNVEMGNDKVLLRLRYKAQLDHLDSVRLDLTFREPVMLEPRWWTPKDDYDVTRRMTCEHLTLGDIRPITNVEERLYGCKLGRMSGTARNRRACLDCKMQSPRRKDPLPSAFKAMSLEEMLSEKVRACLMRGRPRDLYDIWFLQSKGIILDRQMTIDKLHLYQEFHQRIPNIREIRENLVVIEPEWDRNLAALAPSKTYPKFQEALESLILFLEKTGWET